MAPRVPDEIDVFTAPHSRMKELVNIYTQKMQCVDFRDGPEVVSLLRGLDFTLREFKSHESIENIFIMDQLKNRLKQRQITNTAVCDCHGDNRLADVVQVLKTGIGVRQSSIGERLRFGLRLQRAFDDFVSNFIPHMEEEEQVFQPLLVEHFEYEELKILKEVVLKEHELVKELQGREKGQREEQREGETCPDVKDLRDLDCLHLEELRESCLLSDALEEEDKDEEERDNYGEVEEKQQYCKKQMKFCCDESQHHDTSTDTHCMEGKDWNEDCSLDDKQYNRTNSYTDKLSLQNISWGLKGLNLTDTGLEWNNTQELFKHYEVEQLLEDNHVPADHKNNQEWIYNQELTDYQSNDKRLHDQQLTNQEWVNNSDLVCQSEVGQTPSPTLPVEVLVEIFRYLTPPDLCYCAQVSHTWNAAAFAPSLWSSLYPVQWARGIWVPYNVGLCGVLEEEAGRGLGVGQAKWDEDADVDESEQQPDPLITREYELFHSLVTWVLPRVGCGVTTLVVDAGQGITSRLLHHALRLCPSLTTLAAAHTRIDSYAFKGVWSSRGLSRLRNLDLQGCQLVDDSALVYLARCGPSLPVCPIPYLSAGAGQHQCICWNGVTDNTHHNRHSQSRHHTHNSTHSLKYVQNEKPLKCSMYHYQNESTSETDIEEIHCESAKNFVAQNIVEVNSHWEKRAHHIPEYFNNNGKFKKDYHHHQHNNCNMKLHNSSLAEEYSKMCKLTKQMNTTGTAGLCGTNCHSVDGQFRMTQDTLRYSGLQLGTLSLSGCWRVTDFGLGALARAGAVSGLTSLDVSGCYRLSGRGLGALAAACPTLHPENLWYCDNIDNGPYPLQANGCANLANPIRVCCRSGR
ncbi:hypothetical protein Pmani_028485 [Petrolisthes manimaculis]|uniref:F-box domain-containing protein n=1 Tax=Petrolisthes manimaculis TaxID=1843537 RepID=A0AAE1TUU7_9EUCA|nr:hypothetical protein Pmani_028485 [Petrolisthes manimaculis]